MTLTIPATDLSGYTDEELDTALYQAYQEHRDTPPDDRLEIHLVIMALISEQTKRHAHLTDHEHIRQSA